MANLSLSVYCMLFTPPKLHTFWFIGTSGSFQRWGTPPNCVMSLPGKNFAARAEDEEKHRTLAVEEEDIKFHVGFKVSLLPPQLYQPGI